MAGDHVLSIIERNLTFEPIINAVETCLPLVMATKYRATCSNSLLHSQSLEGEEEDDDANDAPDGGRRVVTHIEHYNQHDRQRRYRRR